MTIPPPHGSVNNLGNISSQREVSLTPLHEFVPSNEGAHVGSGDLSSHKIAQPLNLTPSEKRTRSVAHEALSLEPPKFKEKGAALSAVRAILGFIGTPFIALYRLVANPDKGAALVQEKSNPFLAQVRFVSQFEIFDVGEQEIMKDMIWAGEKVELAQQDQSQLKEVVDILGWHAVGGMSNHPSVSFPIPIRLGGVDHLLIVEDKGETLTLIRHDPTTNKMTPYQFDFEMPNRNSTEMPAKEAAEHTHEERRRNLEAILTHLLSLKEPPKTEAEVRQEIVNATVEGVTTTGGELEFESKRISKSPIEMLVDFVNLYESRKTEPLEKLQFMNSLVTKLIEEVESNPFSLSSEEKKSLLTQASSLVVEMRTQVQAMNTDAEDVLNKLATLEESLKQHLS